MHLILNSIIRAQVKELSLSMTLFILKQINIYLCFIDYTKAFDCVDHKTNCGKFLKRWEYQATLPAWETCMQVKKWQLELDMEQSTGSKLGKEYVKVV